MPPLLQRLLTTRYSGWGAYVSALVRAVPGFLFVLISTGKFADHAQEAHDFDRYGIPIPEISTYAVGALELICGLLLIIGLMTRPAAALLALNLVGAIATAGRVEGGTFNLGVGPALLITMLVILWLGPGVPSIDDHLRSRPAPDRA